MCIHLVISMINKEIYFDALMHEMIEHQCSDLHFDISKTHSILFRRHKETLHQKSEGPIASCYEFLRYKAGFDLSKGSLPQTGSFSYLVNEQEYHLRFSSLETFNRKHGVLRVLNMNQIDCLEKSIGSVRVQQFVKRHIRKRSGIILFSGMTGSGKTTTMFNALREISDRQIFTLENPIETHHDFCIQLELNEHQDISFESGLNQLLRHDPDVIVMGEIRSEDDLKQCIRCGLSGHLVTSTIHSSSIEATLYRLLDLNVSIYDLKMCLEGIIYQEMELVGNTVKVKYKTANSEAIAKILDTIQVPTAN